VSADVGLARAAVAHAERGDFIFPVAPRGKEPLEPGGRGYLDATNDVERVRETWARHRDANIGLAPGRSGYLVVDDDEPAVTAAVLDALGVLDVVTRTVRTARGRHLYFRRPAFHVGNRPLAPRVDVRCDKGYVLGEGSVHRSGAVYEWVDSGAAVADLPRRALEAIRAAQALDGAQAPAVPIGWAPPPVPNPEHLKRRVRAYVGAVGSLAEGEGRNNAAYRLAAWLVRDIALPEREAWAWLVHWNAGNRPPLVERELRAAFRSALRNAHRPAGCGLTPHVRPLRAVRPAPTVTALTWLRPVTPVPAAKCAVLAPVRPAGGVP